MDPYIFWKMTVSDLIQLLGVITTIWIAFVVQKNFTKNRYLKDYIIHELSNIRKEYRHLFSDMFNSKLGSKDIKDRLKILSQRLKSTDILINKYLSANKSRLNEAHSGFQQYITGEEEFNVQYKAKVILFSDKVKTQILTHQMFIVNELTQRVIDVNNASRKFRWWLVRNKE